MFRRKKKTRDWLGEMLIYSKQDQLDNFQETCVDHDLNEKYTNVTSFLYLRGFHE